MTTATSMVFWFNIMLHIAPEVSTVHIIYYIMAGEHGTCLRQPCTFGPALTYIER